MRKCKERSEELFSKLKEQDKDSSDSSDEEPEAFMAKLDALKAPEEDSISSFSIAS